MNYKKLMSFCLLVCSMAYAAERTQVIELKKGWNAVYLEIDPEVDKQNLSAFLMPIGDDNKTISIPIEMIATYYPKSSSVEYISDPSNISWKKATWHRWVRDDLPEAFLSNLYDLEANQGYLIKSSRDYTWEVKGEVVYRQKAWQPNSFNLRGFKVKDAASSFHNLLQENNSAKPLLDSPIYSLVNGSWTQINIVDEPVKENHAYWVYSDNTAEFQGTLKLDIGNGADNLSFMDIVDTQDIKLRNTSNNPISITISLENNAVPLSLVGRDALYTRTYTPVSSTVDTFVLGANETKIVKLAVRRNEITDTEEKTGLLKFVVTETNEVIWVSISAYGGTI